MPTIEWTLNLGTIVAIAFGALSFYFVTKNDMRTLKSDVTFIREDIKVLNKVVTDLAVQSTRLDNQGTQLALLQREISDLRRLRGFIMPPVQAEGQG